MKKVSQTQNYSVSADALLAIFKNPEFYKERYNAAGIHDFEIEQCESINGEFVINIKREIKVKMDNMPKMIAKFIGDTLDMNIIMRWKESDTAPYRGTYEVLMERIPVDAKGNMMLQDNTNGCTNIIDLNVSCGIPLVGGKVEDTIARKAEKGMIKDEEGTRKYLDTHNIA